MVSRALYCRGVGISTVVCMTLTVIALGQEPSKEKSEGDKSSASRLRAVREVMSQITMVSDKGNDAVALDLKPDPILRYNDVTRGILDSMIFRIGTKGRPTALISAELYGRQGSRLLLNHEFVALHDPKCRMRRDVFTWEPTSGNLKFQEFPAAPAPAENARLRLVQMRQLSEQFTASQTFGQSQIVLRRLAAPLDRYEPSSDARADGGIFAFAWGVNPEAALFVETDGKQWFYAWAPLSSAPLEAKLNDTVVWQCPPGPHEDRSAPYTSIHRQITVPDYFDQPVEDDAPAN